MTDEEIQRRAFAHFNIDGINELTIGLFLLAAGALQWLQISTPQPSFWNRWYALPLWVLAITSVTHHGGQFLKKRITYPRSGFAEFRRDASHKKVSILFVGTAVGAAALAYAGRSLLQDFVTATALLIGLAMAVTYSRKIARTAQWKWRISLGMAAGSLAIGFAPRPWLSAPAEGSWITTLFPAPLVGACLYSFLLYGTLYIISGGLTFASYVRSTRPA